MTGVTITVKYFVLRHLTIFLVFHFSPAPNAIKLRWRPSGSSTVYIALPRAGQLWSLHVWKESYIDPPSGAPNPPPFGPLLRKKRNGSGCSLFSVAQGENT